MIEGDVVVIGFGTGAIGCIRTILSKTRDRHVTVIEKRDFDTYSPCGMPYALGGHTDPEHLKHEFPGNPGRLKKVLGTEAVEVDRDRKIVVARNLRTGETEDISYKTLVLDLGAEPFIPPIKFNRALLDNGVYTFTSHRDLEKLLGRLPQIKNAVVIGAGAIGLEVALSLHEKGKNVALVDMMAHPLPSAFDPDMGREVRKLIPDSIKTHFGTLVKEITGETSVEKVILSDGTEIPADTVILSAGVRPNTGLAEKMGLSVTRQGISVNEKMQTSDPDIYAVGDCVQTFSAIDRRPLGMRIAPPALHQGTVAGLNIAGEETEYRGTTGAFVTVVNGTEVAGVGLRERDVKGAVSARVKIKSVPEYMGGEDVALKLICDLDGKIVGAQAVGPGAKDIINRVSVALYSGMGVEDIYHVEHAYCPPVSDVFDPLFMAAENLLKKWKRKQQKGQP